MLTGDLGAGEPLGMNVATMTPIDCNYLNAREASRPKLQARCRDGATLPQRSFSVAALASSLTIFRNSADNVQMQPTLGDSALGGAIPGCVPS